jgi:hypothetical protein
MKSCSDRVMCVPLQGCPKSECRLTCVQMQWVHWTNCALCPLLAVSCGDAGPTLFTLSRLREWTIDLWMSPLCHKQITKPNNITSSSSFAFLYFHISKFSTAWQWTVQTVNITLLRYHWIDSADEVQFGRPETWGKSICHLIGSGNHWHRV